MKIALTPIIGFLGDESVLYSLGCVGHSVSMTDLNGRTLCDPASERKTHLTDVWSVNRHMITWSPEPIRMIASQAIREYMWMEDAIYERNKST